MNKKPWGRAKLLANLKKSGYDVHAKEKEWDDMQKQIQKEREAADQRIAKLKNEQNDSKAGYDAKLAMASAAAKSRAGSTTRLGDATKKHRVSVTVSDPMHTMVSMRDKKIEKKVRVSAGDEKSAVELARRHYRKQGFKIHDANYIGIHEETQIEEAVTVKKQNYSWGKMVTVHHGSDTSYPLHPEHQAKIKALKDGEKTSFKDETNRTVMAHREGDKVHLSSRNSGTKTTVAHSHFTEETKQIDEMDAGGDVTTGKPGKPITFKKAVRDSAKTFNQLLAKNLADKDLQTQFSKNLKDTKARDQNPKKMNKEEVELDEGIHKEIAKYAMDNYSSYSKKPGRYEIHKARGYIKNPTGKKIDYDKVQQHVDLMHKQRFGKNVNEGILSKVAGKLANATGITPQEVANSTISALNKKAPGTKMHGHPNFSKFKSEVHAHISSAKSAEEAMRRSSDSHVMSLAKKHFAEEVEQFEEQKKDYYAIVHKATNKVLSVHDTPESAKDEIAGIGEKDGSGVKAHYKVVKTNKQPKTWNMKEEDELDELSQMTLSRYAAKARAQSMDKNNPKRYKRGSGAAQAYDKLSRGDYSEETEQIDELSNRTLSRYIDKAGSEASALKKHAETGEYKDLAKNLLKKREAGLKRAVNTMGNRAWTADVDRRNNYESAEQPNKTRGQVAPFSDAKPSKGVVTDKSGAKHGSMSKARDIARKAMQKYLKKD